jgi:pimeloyl-ACP methyl ester carboxylesterase
MFIKQECYNPTTVEPLALDHWIECVKQPGILRGILETYRAAFKNAEINLEQVKTKLSIPVMTIGAPEFFGPRVAECAEKFAEQVVKSEIYEECGHSLALEKSDRLAKDLIDFFLS